MRLKPRNTVRNDRALHYKRFIGIENSANLSSIYKTLGDNKYWTFDAETLTFSQIDASMVPATSIIKEISDEVSIVQYLDNYFRYYEYNWEKISQLEQGITILSATFNNVAKYQTNKYYFVGSFDFIIKGSIEGTTTQYLKGNIAELKSLTIKHYDDEHKLSPDDLVVIDGHLYAVENPEEDHKHQPKDYKVYFATLVSIL